MKEPAKSVDKCLITTIPFAQAAMMMSLVELKMLQAVKPKEAPLHRLVQ